MASIITRFAPSPTGNLHIGSARTALINYVVSNQNKSSKFYLRIMIKDTPGNLGKVTSILGKFRINIDKVIQNNKALKSKTIPVIILTKSLELKTLNKALKDITKKKLIQKESLIIPGEDLA